MDRLREALEANEWEGNDDEDGEIDLDELEAADEGAEDEEGSIGFGIDPAELEADMAGMKQAIYEGGAPSDDEIEDEETGDKEIQQLQAMMLKMQAVRGKSLEKMVRKRFGLTEVDLGADLPEAERKRLAAKTVKDIMKTL